MAKKADVHGAYTKLRLEAMAAYVSSIDGVTVEQLHQDPRFAKVALKTLRKWAAADGWTKYRQQALARVRERLTAELESRLEENVFRELRDLLDLRERTLEHLQKVAPKTYEGTLRAFLLLNERMEALAERVVSAKEGARPAHRASFDVDQLRSVARGLNAERRSALRARAARRDHALVQK